MNKTKGSVTVILNPLKFSDRLNNSTFANFAGGRKCSSVLVLSALSY